MEWCVPNASVGGRVTVADAQPLDAKTGRLCLVAATILSSPIAIARCPRTLRSAGRLENSQTGSIMKLETRALRGLPVTRSERRAPRSGEALHLSKPGSSSRDGAAVRAKPQEWRGSQRSKEERLVVVVGDALGLSSSSSASRAAAAAEAAAAAAAAAAVAAVAAAAAAEGGREG